MTLAGSHTHRTNFLCTHSMCISRQWILNLRIGRRTTWHILRADGLLHSRSHSHSSVISNYRIPVLYECHRSYWFCCCSWCDAVSTEPSHFFHLNLLFGFTYKWQDFRLDGVSSKRHFVRKKVSLLFSNFEVFKFSLPNGGVAAHSCQWA